MSGFFSSLFSGAAAGPIDAIGKAGDALFTSDEERKQLDNDLVEIKQKPLLMQALANVTAANHRSMFVAGGRPAMLWVAAMGLFFFFPVKYAFGTFLWVKTCLLANELLPYPFSGESLMDLVVALLGLATLRTVEKAKGISK